MSITATKVNSLQAGSSRGEPTLIKVEIGNFCLNCEIIVDSKGARESLTINPDEIKRVQALATTLLKSMNLSPHELQNIQSLSTDRGLTLKDGTSPKQPFQQVLTRERLEELRTIQEGKIRPSGHTCFQEDLLNYFKDIEHNPNTPPSRDLYKSFSAPWVKQKCEPLFIASNKDEKETALKGLLEWYFPSIDQDTQDQAMQINGRCDF